MGETFYIIGPQFGYFVNPSTTWLVTKEGSINLASRLFSNTNVSITAQGIPVLGSPVGTLEYMSSFVNQKSRSGQTISGSGRPVNHTQHTLPWHMVCPANGTISQEQHLTYNIPCNHLKFPSRISYSQAAREKCSKRTRKGLVLPTCCAGGLNISNPVVASRTQYEDSLKITRPLVELILTQSMQIIPLQCQIGPNDSQLRTTPRPEEELRAMMSQSK